MQCTVYLKYSWHCRQQAVYRLIQDDGKPNPGSYVCEEHGRAILSEYLDKLGEHWSLEPFNEE